MRYTYRPRTRGFAQHQLAQRRGAGFTLIELMVVVAIVGILLAVFIPAIKRYVDRSRKADAAQNIASPTRAEVIRVAERAGLSQIDVVDMGDATSKTAWHQICRTDNDFVYEIDATDKQERRIRLTICCHLTARSAKCAIPLPMHPFPGDR